MEATHVAEVRDYVYAAVTASGDGSTGAVQLIPSASISLRAGTPLKVVSQALGHATTAITADIYTHVLGELLSEAAKRIDAIFDAAERKRAVGARETTMWAKREPQSDRGVKTQ